MNNELLVNIGIKNTGNFILDYFMDAIYLKSLCVKITNSLQVGTGATGTFTSEDGKVITVVKGIVISIQ